MNSYACVFLAASADLGVVEESDSGYASKSNI
jgi:hypothetical protein